MERIGTSLAEGDGSAPEPRSPSGGPSPEQWQEREQGGATV
jgi:hypothetical protein